MACFLVPAAEAIAVTAVYAVAKVSEKKKLSAPKIESGKDFSADEPKLTWSKKLSWLLTLLVGGAFLLAFEHFWHGEVVPFAPFLSAMANPEDAAEMVHEMATVGVGMAFAVTAVWGVICAVADAKVKQMKKALKSQSAK